jgi:hypothetical protein
MKLIYVLVLLCSTLAIAQRYDISIEETLDLQEYRERKNQINTIHSQLNELEKNPCIINNDNYNECSKPFSLMQELLENYHIHQDRLFELKMNIYPYLDENDQILTSIEQELEERFPINQACVTTPLSELIEQADSMLIFIQQLKKQGSYERFMDIPNAKKRDCDKEIPNDCWEVDPYGTVYYITKYGLKISSDCLLSSSDGYERPQIFSSKNIIQSANSAVNKLQSCFGKLNPSESNKVMSKILNHEYVMMCTPNSDGGNDHRCGFTRRGQDYFNLVFNQRGCEGYEETIFHEILHMNSNVDNLQTHNHNRGECSKHDAVYYCARSCFPRSQRPKIKFSKKACQGCVKNPEQSHLCSNSNIGTINFDQSYINCK